jgi:hypothetical protein
LTGIVIWVGERGFARHDIAIKVSLTQATR